MWAARLLLLFVGVAAFHLHETTPEPTFLDVDEATSIILPADPSKAQAVLLEAARRRLEHKETRAEMLKMLEGELHNELFRLSYADVKQFIPKQIIDFFESLSMNDTQHLQMALTVSEQAAAKVLQEHPESNASQVFEAALKAGLDHLRYNDDELWREVMELYELFNARIGRLKPQNFKRVGLWIEGWFAAMKEADGRATESDLEILKAAREEFAERPLFNEGAIKDWYVLFPELMVFYKSRLYNLLWNYYYVYQKGQPLFHYEN